jgi:hypothetical protein
MNKIPDHLYLPVTPAGWNYIRQMLDSRPHGEVRVLVDGLDAAVAQQIEQANTPARPPTQTDWTHDAAQGKPNGSGAAAEQEHP